MQTQARAHTYILALSTRPYSIIEQTTGYKMTDVFANLFHTFTKLKDTRNLSYDIGPEQMLQRK